MMGNTDDQHSGEEVSGMDLLEAILLLLNTRPISSPVFLFHAFRADREAAPSTAAPAIPRTIAMNIKPKNVE